MGMSQLQRCYRHDWVPRISLCFANPVFRSHVFPFLAREQGESQTHFLAYSSGAALPSWAIQTAEVRCLGCPFNPQAPLKTSPERPMCWDWKKGGGNREQMGVCEHFQPPCSSGTWLWVAWLRPPALTPHLWILFCYGDSTYLFL